MHKSRANKYLAGESKVHPADSAPPDSDPPAANGRDRAFTSFGTVARQQSRLNAVNAREVIHLLHRIAVLVAAVFYIAISSKTFHATATSLSLTNGLKAMTNETYTVTQIGQFLGTTTIRQSPLMETLGNITVLRNDTLYLDLTGTSFQSCSNLAYDTTLYGNDFLRTTMATLMDDTNYQFTFFADMELIVPIVDCTFWPLQVRENSLLRAHFVMRARADHDDISILTLELTTMDYSIPEQIQSGACGLATFTIFNDMRVSNIAYHYALSLGYPFDPLSFESYEHTGVESSYHTLLTLVPKYALYEAPSVVSVSLRRGFYVDSEADQANVLITRWETESTPATAISTWDWRTGCLPNDSWAWVHLIHLYFAADAIFNLLVLSLLMYRNAQAGTLWIGDGFASISNSLVTRGALILITWGIDKFWMIIEYSLYEANRTIGFQKLYILTDLVHADIMTLYLCIAAVVGYVLRERVDPACAILLFEGSYQFRESIITWFPAIISSLGFYAVEDFMQGTASVDTSVSGASPMEFRTVHELEVRSADLIFKSLSPILLSLIAVFVFCVLHRVYRHFRPNKLHVIKTTSYSDKKENFEAQKGEFTMFEIATGAALQVRFGVVTSYENCVIRKGIKYATADGIYCGGYVIANGKYLIAIDNLLPIILMKLVHVRFTNVYIHDVTGKNVQRTSRLVYPQTMSWEDLMKINIDMLS